MLRAIRMCLRPKVSKRNNTTRLLASLGYASGPNYTSGIISILDYSPSYVYIFIFLLIVFIPNMYINNMYFGILIHFKD